MNEGWQIVRERPQRRPKASRRAYVSINTRGEIAMNAEAYGRIGEPANVTLLYEPATRRIGIKFPVALDRNFFPVRRYGRDRKMRIVRAARLLKQFDIQIDRTLVCKNPEAWIVDGEPMLVFGIDEGESWRYGLSGVAERSC